MHHTDVIIAGAGFAGLACARTLAERGIAVTVLERKNAPGSGMHTTGIIVGECARAFSFPESLTRKITEVRLYAPSLRYIDLRAADYFFLATDTPALMRHLSDDARRAGATILYDTPYQGAREEADRLILTAPDRSCRFLIGADGPRSRVAEDFSLGRNTQFLLGAEAEYTGLAIQNPNAFFCFLDQHIAPGYLGWVVPGVGIAQVGVAARMPARPDIDAFTARMRAVLDFSSASVTARRGGLIPVGGLVKPFARGNVLLLGDAAGIVSPLTAGGIHTALHFGTMLGNALADHLHLAAPHPAAVLARVYPRFRTKLALRWAFERLAPNWLLNAALCNPVSRCAAGEVFFREKKLRA